MENKLISIIVPCYNNAKTIIETLESILRQSYKNIEIIIVNDGSKDDCVSIISEFIEGKNNIKLISQENSGPSKARNNGVINSLGYFLLFVDGDDMIHENYVSEAISVFENDEKVELVYADADFFGEKTGLWKLQVFDKNNFLIENCIPIFCVVKSSTFIKVGMFDEKLKFTEDWELWIKIIFYENGEVFKLPNTRYFYRKNASLNSLTDLNEISNKKESDRSRLYIYSKHYELFEKNNLDITSLITCYNENQKYKKKYYNIWYKKMFYFLKRKKRYF